MFRSGPFLQKEKMKIDKYISIVWFRRDLRLQDNAALSAAISRDGGVIPVFIVSPEDEGSLGAPSRWWLDKSLRSLSGSLEKAGSRLIIRAGRAERILPKLVEETNATSVIMNRRYEPATNARDERIMNALEAEGIVVSAFNDSLLFDPSVVRNRTGGPYRVFTPYWKRLLEMGDPGLPMPTTKPIPAPSQWPESANLDDLGLVRQGDDGDGWGKYWQPGETSALKTFKRFLQDGIHDYSDRHNLPGENGTSRLSPHLHFGEISPRRVWHDIRKSNELGDDQGSNPYLRQLVWREFSYYLLHHFPESVRAPLRKPFESFPWRDDMDGLEAWKNGLTGYPLVDAGMRELSATGWMHNRVRMVAASFLVKHLMIHWLEGAKWFMEKLVDADLANNTMGWQWTAGSGADAAPYFRVFNPVLQGTRFDRNGEYVRKWVPELAALPDRYIHCPWKAPEDVVTSAGVEIGRDYPACVVDHDFARARALNAYDSLGGAKSSKTVPDGGK